MVRRYTDSLPISELFVARQGVGVLTGIPMPFVRVAGCPLGCSWCDAKFTWEAGYTFTEMALDTVLAWLEVALPARAQSAGWVALTGGEPTLYPVAAERLVRTLWERRGAQVLLETNGIGYFDWLDTTPSLFYSAALKLPASGQDTPARRRSVARSVARRMARADLRARTQWKFVIAEPHDLEALPAYCAEAGIPQHAADDLPPVVLVPDGTMPDRRAYIETLGWLQEAAPAWTRVQPQVHRIVHGAGTRGV
jgi:organic radical activating enzyme